MNKVIMLVGEKAVKIHEIIKRFLENAVSDNPPKFIIVTGGTGSGKTTIRRQNYSKGYVNFDFGDIMTAIKNEFGKDNPKLKDYAIVIGETILDESINSKKNIVIELIGDNKAIMEILIDQMVLAGYKVFVNFVGCDIEDAYSRHLKAVQEDKDYYSCYYTEEATLAFFYNKFGLGPVPIDPR